MSSVLGVNFFIVDDLDFFKVSGVLKLESFVGVLIFADEREKRGIQKTGLRSRFVYD